MDGVSAARQSEEGVSMMKPEEIAVVSHSIFLACLAATELTEYGKPVYPAVLNAKPFQLDIEKLLLLKHDD